MDWKEELMERGFVVIPLIFSRSESRNYIRRIRGQLTRAIGQEDMNAFLKRTAVNGVVHGLDNLRVLWEIRTNPKIRAIFQELYENKSLFLYVDRFNYRPHGHDPFQEQWHIDEDPVRPQSNYQAFISLTGSTEKDDCIGIMEKNHLYMEEYLSHFATSPFCKEQYDWFIQKGCEARRVACPPGSLVLWDSRCYHTPLNSLRTTPKTRLVVYVRYFPTDRFPKKERLRILYTYPQYTNRGLDIVTEDKAGMYKDYICGTDAQEDEQKSRPRSFTSCKESK